MHLTDIGLKVVEYGGYLILLGLAVEYVREVAGQEASEAVRRHELWEHQEYDEQDA